jgi:hypothetical protein
VRPPLRSYFGGRSPAVTVFRRDRRVLARIVRLLTSGPAGGPKTWP